MEITVQKKDTLLQLGLEGRFDAFGSNQIQELLAKELTPETQVLLLDMRAVNYLSSAGLRVLLMYYKQLKPTGGIVALAGLQEYCREVIAMTGFADSFPQFETTEEAQLFCTNTVRSQSAQREWEQLPVETTEEGSFRLIPGTETPGSAEILGDIRDILHSAVTTEKIYSKRFFDTEFSIGMGGLGGCVDDYINLLGEMITVGGTMVWLPTDGHDTADFLIPQTDQGEVMIRTGFNVSLKGGFNELIHFTSQNAGGTPIGSLYRALFTLAKQRRPDFRGALGLTVRAQMGSVYGSGIKKSAVIQNAPENGKMILHETNIHDWFDSDSTPRHTHVTALMVGVGADLTADLSDYNEEDFNRVFYLHPVNIGGKKELLHNHGVIFNQQPMPAKPVDLEKEIRTVINDGDFMDMRHMLDSSTITQALIGVNYIQQFKTDPEGAPLDEDDKQQDLPDVVKNQMKYYKS